MALQREPDYDAYWERVRERMEGSDLKEIGYCMECGHEIYEDQAEDEGYYNLPEGLLHIDCLEEYFASFIKHD